MRQNEYQIVFLDHMMPGMDGIETLRKMKEENLVPEQTTMIALTANAVIGAKETYLEAGFQDYLSKPMEMKLLVQKLKQYLPAECLKQKKQHEIFEFAADEEETSKSEESDAAPESSLPAYDMDRLKASGVNTEEGVRYCGDDEALWNLWLERRSDAG